MEYLSNMYTLRAHDLPQKELGGKSVFTMYLDILFLYMLILVYSQHIQESDIDQD